MVVRRAKKSRKMRAHRTMGWGTKGQHRDRGAEGGRHVGMHKEKWSWIVKYGKDWYGKHGFVNPTSKKLNAISLRKLGELIESGKIQVTNKDGKLEVDLEKLGYDKLLGGGQVKAPLIVKVAVATNKAKEKIEKSGGQVILTPQS
ncbi:MULTISPECIES: uL15 family ribosomal protein [Metallosphaera]|uniref:Large ribosomal subunit protein uL15 n=3 Tax=Metallosphaera TaxID=41980 RepID=A4YCY8_METS5|nr:MULTISPECIES: uL15 family ribosomal protein [Metallosphaera]ABP94290.1 LSU ribosomal protein L15P [Metallosphaera sedula DSM 5348]AIM26277.1 LSU ribosomal protein L15P [Metallosphaera sedula]AKV73291.1 50S ribosomal protein L15 [Metallosphaera sedula]AKV75535.1 50S ribosomal protein L15 [Metallosphaera sedula]AKV77781.1 50S ribosomal protein L15 [Metallosphaera sedula]